MIELTPETRAELRERVAAMTPGKREPVVDQGRKMCNFGVVYLWYYGESSPSRAWLAHEMSKADAEHLAAFDRETCLALLDAADERDRLRAELEFLKEKGITVGMMKTSDRPQPYLAYGIRSGSELDDTRTINRIAELEADLARLARDTCDDDLHARCDAILGSEVIDPPPGSGRTPVAGDDGRVAAAFAKLKLDRDAIADAAKKLLLL